MRKDCLNIGAPRICHCFIKIHWLVLMFSFLAGVSEFTVHLGEICAGIGQAVALFSNISSNYEDPTLYYKGNTVINSWEGNTSHIKDPLYNRKFHMDDKRNIWILHVERENAGIYSVKFGVKPERLELDIILTVKDKLTECPDFPKEDRSNSGVLIAVIFALVIETLILIGFIICFWKQIKERFKRMNCCICSTPRTESDIEKQDEHVKCDTNKESTLNYLPVSVTDTEDNQNELLSRVSLIPSPATFSAHAPSVIQPFSNDKHDSNPEHATAQDVREDTEDSDSEDKCQEPLLNNEARM